MGLIDWILGPNPCGPNVWGNLPTTVDVAIPKVDASFLSPFVPLVRARAPKVIWHELETVAAQVGSMELTLYYNLNYELFGLACLSGVLPDWTTGGYRFYRRLEWAVGYNPKFQFVHLTPSTQVRHTPGFVGALSGGTKEWHLALNAAADYDTGGRNYRTGLPIAWILRQAIAMDRDFDSTCHWLTQQESVCTAFVIIASREEARWIHIGPKGGFVHETALVCGYPYMHEDLIVKNVWELYDRRQVLAADWEGIEYGPYQNASTEGWTLDKYTVLL